MELVHCGICWIFFCYWSILPLLFIVTSHAWSYDFPALLSNETIPEGYATRAYKRPISQTRLLFVENGMNPIQNHITTNSKQSIRNHIHMSRNILYIDICSMCWPSRQVFDNGTPFKIPLARTNGDFKLLYHTVNIFWDSGGRWIELEVNQCVTTQRHGPVYFDGRSEYFMMTSSNGNIFRVTGHLCGKFTGPRWISRTKASDAELWCFLWFNKRLSKQPWGWWFETPAWSLWRHRNVSILATLLQDFVALIQHIFGHNGRVRKYLP